MTSLYVYIWVPTKRLQLSRESSFLWLGYGTYILTYVFTIFLRKKLVPEINFVTRFQVLDLNPSPSDVPSR